MVEIAKRRASFHSDTPRDYIESYLAHGIKTGEACFNDDGK